MRKKIVAGNWKMNKSLKEGIDLARSINENLSHKKPGDTEVVVCTPFIHISNVSEIVDYELIKTGAQNCSSEESGAYTGEISAEMIRSAGAEYVIIGHSERRSLFKEDSETLLRKVMTALKNNLKVIFCCGEVLGDRQKNNHFDIVKEQLYSGLFDLSQNEFSNIVIAYEPVWAIGTGVTASSDQAQEMHNFIRDLVKEKYTAVVAENTTLLYGGSCNAKNANELFSMEDVDGGLIGGASLNAADFCTIINSY